MDEMNDQLRYTRALEIIDKVITLHDMSTEAERQEVAFIDDFGMDRTQLRTTLQTHWYTMHADSQ